MTTNHAKPRKPQGQACLSLLAAGIPSNAPSDAGSFLDGIESIPGFKAALYRNYLWNAASDDRYVLAFAGTDDFADVVEDLLQGTGFAPTQYPIAMQIAVSLKDTSVISSDFVITGHSLGGGLAASAAIAANIKATTFNAAAVNEYSIYERDPETFDLLLDGNGEYIELYPGIYDRFVAEGGVLAEDILAIETEYTNSTLISNFFVDFDPLTAFQTLAVAVPAALGSPSMLNGYHHSLELFIQAITSICDWSEEDPTEGWLELFAPLQPIIVRWPRFDGHGNT